MSYRLIDANELAIKYPEVNDMPCIYADLPNGLDNEHYVIPSWIPVSERLPEDRRAVFVTAYWHETYQVMMASYYGDGLWWCVPFNNCVVNTCRN